MAQPLPEPEFYDIGDNILLEGIFTTAKTVGEIYAGQNTLSVQDVSGFAPTNKVFIEGAGTIDGDLTATVTAINGNIVSLDTVAGTTVHRANVGKLFDPSGAVSVKVRLPDATTSSPAVSRNSIGRFQATYKPTLKGDHFYRFVDVDATGLEGAEEQQFVVRERQVT